MSQAADITVQEYGRVEDVIKDYIRQRETELPTREIASTADVSLSKVNEALLHMSRKYECLVDAGAEGWELQLPSE